MNALLDWTLWWPLPGLLAVEAAALVVCAGVLHRLVGSAAWRRTLWQACVVSFAVLVALEATGVARVVMAGSRERPATRATVPGHSSERRPSLEFNQTDAASMDLSANPSVSRNAPVSASAHVALEPEMDSPSITQRNPVASPESAAGLSGWLMLIWLLGAATVLGWTALNQVIFFWSRRGSRAVTDSEADQRVRILSRQLGLRRTVRLIESPRFAGPIAFGVLRPVVGLPPRFATDHRPDQQDVMLAHELAHLAAGDPVWYRLADVSTALLWWHPAVWWARRQLRAASEVAADEASLLVANGPGVLAECLVALGARLVQPRVAGGMGIEGSGYRSGLGRRVHRLVNLGGRAWRPQGRGAVTVARILGPVTLVLTLTVCAGWTFPDTSNKGATMKLKHWQQALSVLTLATTLGAEQAALPDEPPAKVTTKPDANSVIAAQPILGPPVAVKVSTAEIRALEGKGVRALREKLERITLSEVTYDATPLNEVVEDLIRKSTEIDPEEKGVNFLFGQERAPAALPAVDPATGLPVVTPPPEDFDLRSVTIVVRPPLKNLRLIDVLDAIVKVADQPIKYSIEEYAVVFNRSSARGAPNPPTHNVFSSPAAPGQATALQTRTFKVNTNTFFASIERMFHQKINPGSQEVGIWLQRDVFPKAGARLASPDALVLYNDLTGILLVRGSAEELDAVQSAVETFGGARVSVTGAAAKPSGKSSFLKHLAEGPHTHLHRAVTGVFDALGNLAPPPFNRSGR